MFMTPKRLSDFAALLGICLVCALPVHGQSDTRIRGLAVDPTGGPLPRADVTLFSDERVLATKTDESGEFQFSPLPAGIHYLQVSATGFNTRSMSIEDKPSGLILLPPLEPGTSGGPCGGQIVAPPFVSYEERTGNVLVMGQVSDVYGDPLPGNSLTLMKAGPGDALKRFFEGTFIAQSSTDNEGKFQFAALEPGWYSLRIDHDGYFGDLRAFWIARENLTKLLSIYLIPLDVFTCKVPIPRPAKPEGDQ
jgi:hypothetical protein